MKPNSCQICGRQLKDANSIARGFGPECAAKRAAFLATCGTSDEELDAIKRHENPLVSRWANNFYQDMRAGRLRRACQCIESARYQAERFGSSLVARMTIGNDPVVTVLADGLDSASTSVAFTDRSGDSNDNDQPCSTVAVTTVDSATAAPVSQDFEFGEPFITVREIERGGYYVRTPFKLEGFVSAFKCVVGGTWHPEKESWYVPASHLTWTIEALEYWFCIPVRVEPFKRAGTMSVLSHTNQQSVGVHP